MRPILTAESVTELGATARGAVLVAGSHGGLIACYLGAAAGAHAMILNDAGVGLDDAGIAGLKWLEPIGMAVATVLHTSARIGDGADSLAHGVISHVNACAAAAGVRPGQRASDAAVMQKKPEGQTNKGLVAAAVITAIGSIAAGSFILFNREPSSPQLLPNITINNSNNMATTQAGSATTIKEISMTVIVKETVVVPQTVVVQQTVPVPQTTVVEKPVEVTRIVEVTPQGGQPMPVVEQKMFVASSRSTSVRCAE